MPWVETVIVAVGRGASELGDAEVAARADLVLDVELLAHGFGQALRERARHDVERAAGRRQRDDAHRPRRIALRQRGWHGREHDRRQRDDAYKYALHSCRSPRFPFLIKASA
jgi:hypothetical protein